MLFNEECDDANIFPGDGCSDCSVDDGYECFDMGNGTSTCSTICGNTIFNDPLIPSNQILIEECDNAFAIGDGCDLNCMIELGWECSGSYGLLSTCNLICSNGILNDPSDPRQYNTEECDDQNLSTGDGCDENCLIETGWECPPTIGSLSVCNKICSNGILNDPLDPR